MTTKKQRTGKDPAFLFYQRDWLSSARIQTMSHAAEASYVRLLCHQADTGLLPADLDVLRRLTKCTPAEWRRVWPEIEHAFPEVEGGRLNPKLVAVMAERAERSSKNSVAGTLGNEVRWGRTPPDHPPKKGGRKVANASQPASQNHREPIANSIANGSQNDRETIAEGVASGIAKASLAVAVAVSEPPSSPDGEEAPPSSSAAPPALVGLEARLPERARATYRALREAHPKPWAFDALLETSAEPIGGGQRFTFAHLGAALVQLAGATPPVPISQKTLRGWMRENAVQDTATTEAVGTSVRDRLVMLLRAQPLPSREDPRWAEVLGVPQAEAVRLVSAGIAHVLGVDQLPLPGVAHFAADHVLGLQHRDREGAA